MFTAILTFIAGLTRFLPVLEKWADLAYGAWKDAQERAQKASDDNRAATLAARQDANSADLARLRAQAEQDAIAAAATAALLTAKARAASEAADAPTGKP